MAVFSSDFDPRICKGGVILGGIINFVPSLEKFSKLSKSLPLTFHFLKFDVKISPNFDAKSQNFNIFRGPNQIGQNAMHLMHR